jgi:hypothetical protein
LALAKVQTLTAGRRPHRHGGDASNSVLAGDCHNLVARVYQLLNL